MKERFAAARKSYSSHTAVKVTGQILAAIYAVFLYYLIEMFNYSEAGKFFRFVGLHPKSALFGLLVTLLLCAIVYLATRRAWIAALGVGILYYICGLINYLKVALNGDNFMPWDLTMTGKMGELMSFVNVRLPWWGYVFPLIAAVCIVYLWFAEIRLPRFRLWIRIASPVAAALLLFIPLHQGLAPKTFKCFGMDFMDASLQSSNYRANGFVGAFTLNLASTSVNVPGGYSQKAVEELMADYTDTPGTDKPDVIVILCESFWDIRKLPGTTFSVNPLQNYDALCQSPNARSGYICTTALGGGTVRTEFDMLTGLTVEALPAGASPHLYAKKDYPTYVSEYKKQGYKTVALHPYDKSFYARNRAYSFIGFDEFYGEDEMKKMVDATYQRGYFSDDSFVDALIGQLEQNQDSPTFLFGISMENHQTYYPLDEYEFDVQNPALDEDLSGAVHTYAQGVYHSDKALGKLVDYINHRDKKTLLVFFGDHLPTLGANYAAYKATGLFDGEDEDVAECVTMYSSPFVIYGNFELGQSSLKQRDNLLSDYYLMSHAAELGGTARSKYMNLLLAEEKEFPYYSKRLKMEWTPENHQFKNMHLMLSYDRLIGHQYSAN